MKKAADWETRLSVKFVEYLNCGLQVIVGKYVGEAVRYANDGFSERCVVYDFDEPLQTLSTRKTYDNEKVDKIFGLQNFEKVK